MRNRTNSADDPVRVFSIPLDLITIPDNRTRSLKAAQAAAIGAAMAADGQYDAIKVAQLPGRTDYILVDGLHRVEGARGEGWAVIDARIVAADADERRRHEVLSGWARAGEDVFDRAAGIKALADLARDDAPDRRRGRRERLPKEIEADGDVQFAMIAKCTRWDAATAEALGISLRSVRNYAVVADRIAPDLVARLRAAGHAEQLVPLLKLANVETGLMPVVVAHLEADCATIAEAIAAALGQPKPGVDAATKRLSTFIDSFNRMDRAERLGAVRDFLARADANVRAAAVEDLARNPPKGWRIERSDDVAARIVG